ncbi:hypothetical protein X801_01781, partial [Opisthorchis viverrini]
THVENVYLARYSSHGYGSGLPGGGSATFYERIGFVLSGKSNRKGTVNCTFAFLKLKPTAVCSTKHLDQLVHLYGLDKPATSSPTALCTRWLRKGGKEVSVKPGNKVIDTPYPAGRCQTAPRFNIPKASWDCQATKYVASYPKNKDRNTWPKTPQERAGLVVTYPGVSEARDKYAPPPKAVTEVFSNYGVLQQLQPGYRVNPHQDYHIKGWSPLPKREPTGSETTEYKLKFTWPSNKIPFADLGGASTQYAAYSCCATETSVPEGMKTLKLLGSEPYVKTVVTVRVTSLFSYGNKYMIGTENGVIKEGHFHILCRIVALFLLLPF